MYGNFERGLTVSFLFEHHPLSLDVYWLTKSTDSVGSCNNINFHIDLQVFLWERRPLWGRFRPSVNDK